MSISRRLARLERAAMPPPEHNPFHCRQDWDRYWNIVVDELARTMTQAHLVHVTAQIYDVPDEDWSGLTRTLTNMVERASGYLLAPWHGPLALPAIVADALLANPNARLSRRAECARCGFANPFDDTLDEPTLAEKLRPGYKHPGRILDGCGVCGHDDVEFLRYEASHDHEPPPAWEPWL